MDIIVAIEEILPAIQSRINKSFTDVIGEFNSRGTVCSTASLMNSIDAGFAALDNEIKILVERISVKNMIAEQWDSIELRLKRFIDSEYIRIIERCEKHTGFKREKIDNIQFDNNVNIKKNETIAYLTIFIDAQRNH